jgi:hypothetical protein
MSRRREPCFTCGEETAAGSVFYSDRFVLGAIATDRRFLCSLCAREAAARRRPPRLSEAETRAFIENGSMAGLAWGRGVSGL